MKPTKEQLRFIRKHLSDYTTTQFRFLHIDTRNMIIYEIVELWEKIRS